MALLERQGDSAVIIEDRFQPLDDEEELPSSGAVLVSLSRFQSERAALISRESEVGVRLEADESPNSIAEDLGRIAMVALDFPVFSDGRAYSSARLLRERFGYEGEVRAVGDVLCEQLSFMLRSGFDTFEMASDHALDEFKAVVSEVRVVYQPTGDGRPTARDERMRRIGREQGRSE